jgi:hypothetical protein
MLFSIAGSTLPAQLLPPADEVVKPPRVHHAARRRGGGMAARGARSAAVNAGGRVYQW